MTYVPATPYYGKSISQPEAVLAAYPDPDVVFGTPAFKREEGAFTTQEEMWSFLSDLNAKTKEMSLTTLGYSQEGRAIPFVYFTKDALPHSESAKAKPTVWLQAEIHGNEPASGESALVIAQELAEGELKSVLDEIHVVIVPRINPDGSYHFVRQVANGLDANRDHMNLLTPETQVLHAAFQNYEAAVVIDAHEYGLNAGTFQDVGAEGGYSYYDMLLLSGKNLNIPADVRLYSDYLFLENAFSHLADAGLSSHLYFTSSRNEDGVTVNEGGTQGSIGRNAFGLKPAFSFLTESRGIGIGRENFKRRVLGQVITHTSILKTTATNAALVKTFIQNAREEVANSSQPVVVQSESVTLPNQTVFATDIETGAKTEVPVTYQSETFARPTLERTRPDFYLLPPAYTPVANQIENQGIEVKATQIEETFEVETFVAGEEGVVTTNKDVTFPSGSYIFSMKQSGAGALPVLLEADSEHGVIEEGMLTVPAGREIPIYRVIQ
ncbi:M14 family metallopeptidase [Shouchella shacheensis]|uniref:M14 family metallopeptidase n=1 Tax=Shouchella shacheensis TaxID=1649580 RepID=UPI00073FBEAD|nr:M14 family metallocarboxypeptidase [Shouchella shacheensis]